MCELSGAAGCVHCVGMSILPSRCNSHAPVAKFNLPTQCAPHARGAQASVSSANKSENAARIPMRTIETIKNNPHVLKVHKRLPSTWDSAITASIPCGIFCQDVYLGAISRSMPCYDCSVCQQSNMTLTYRGRPPLSEMIAVIVWCSLLCAVLIYLRPAVIEVVPVVRTDIPLG